MQKTIVAKGRSVYQYAHQRMDRPVRISAIYRLTGTLELTKHELFVLQ